MALPPALSRRLFLKGSALIGCSAAAHPLMSGITLASAPWDQRLVVIILRGAMDGLDVVRPVGDPAFADLRPGFAAGAGGDGLPLDGFYALHPALAGLKPWWDAGELGFVHAVSTPYRDKRSHFDGQDLLESGTGFDLAMANVQDGWLNRMLQVVPGMQAETAFALGRDEMKVLRGAAPFTQWSPTSRLTLTPQARTLLEQVYHEDPLFRDAALSAMDLAERLAEPAEMAEMAAMEAGMKADLASAPVPARIDPVAAFAAARLNEDTRIAAFSIAGWDTHRDQEGALRRSLGALQNTLLTLKDGLGPNWRNTAVVAMTEFGRTARQNGSNGTDHGTGGLMLLAGGAVRGGRVLGQWPGLAEADLYARRDLMPTSDVRAHAAWVMRGMFGLDAALIENTVFPGLDMGSDPGLLL